MNQKINLKIEQLKRYLKKDPSAAIDLALHFYGCYLELQYEASILEEVALNLIEEQSTSPTLPSFTQPNRSK